MVQWLKLPAWKVGIRGFEPHSGLQVSKKQNISSPLTRKKSILWGSLRDRGVACLIPPGLEFRVLCLKGSVISFTSPSSRDSPGPA